MEVGESPGVWSKAPGRGSKMLGKAGKTVYWEERAVAESHSIRLGAVE